MINPNNSKYICQVDKLPNLVPFHFRDFFKDPQAQHPPNTSYDSQVSNTIHMPYPST